MQSRYRYCPHSARASVSIICEQHLLGGILLHALKCREVVGNDLTLSLVWSVGSGDLGYPSQLIHYVKCDGQKALNTGMGD